MASGKVPKNQKLWNSLRRQAQAKYPVKRKQGGLSQPAAKWLAEAYEREGGSYVGSKQELAPEDRDLKQEQLDKKKRKQQRLKKQREQQGFI